MKQLHEYETPITNAMRSGIPHPKAVQVMLASHGDLERKLAMCRDVLKLTLDSCTNIPDSVITAISQALDQTK